MSDYNKYFTLLAEQEAKQALGELEAIRNSLRYQVGSLVLESFPLSRRSFNSLKKIINLFIEYRRNNKITKSKIISELNSELIKSSNLILLYSKQSKLIKSLSNDCVLTDDPQELVGIMDGVETPSLLILQQIDQEVLRRLARWQALGGSIQWQPVDGVEYPVEQVAYLEELLTNPVEVLK